MNLIFRLMMSVILNSFLKVKDPLSDESEFFWCLPWDCDINLHMTNSRYFAFADLGRIVFMCRKKIFFSTILNGMTPIIKSQRIFHLKGIAPFKKFELNSKILFWDDHNWFFEHNFIQDGQLKAKIFSMGVFVKNRRVIPFNVIVGGVGKNICSPDFDSKIAKYLNDYELSPDKISPEIDNKVNSNLENQIDEE